MDNYDFYEQNLMSARTSEGALQEQADIYAESWEAAEKRVRTAAQAIYQDLLDDEAFIDFLDTTEKILTGIDKMINSVGGLGGVVSSLGFLFTKVFYKQINQSLVNSAYSLQTWTKKGRDALAESRNLMVENALKSTGIVDTGSNSSADIQARVIKSQLENQQKLLINARDLTEEETRLYQVLLDQQKARGEMAIKEAETLEALKKKSQEAEMNLYSGEHRLSSYELNSDEWFNQQADLGQLRDLNTDLKELQSEFHASDISFGEALEGKHGDDWRYKAKIINDIINGEQGIEVLLDRLAKNDAKLKEKLRTDSKAWAEVSVQVRQVEKAAKSATKELDLESQNSSQENKPRKYKINREKDKTRKYRVDQEKTEAINQDSEAARRRVIKVAKEGIYVIGQEAEAQKKTGEAIKDTNGKFDQQDERLKRNAQNFTNATSAILGFTGAMQAIGTLPELWESEADLSEKIMQTVFSLGVFGSMSKGALEALNEMQFAIGGTDTKLGVLAMQKGPLKGLIGIFTKNLPAAIGPLVALATYAGAATIAIAGIGWAINKGIDYYNRYEIAAENAANAAKDLGDRAQETKSQLDSIASSIEQYDSLVAALNECRDSGIGFNEALQAVNDSIWEILEQYPELAKMDNLFKEDGALNQETVDRFIEEKEQNARATKVAALAATASASQARVEADKINSARQFARESQLQDNYLINRELKESFLQLVTSFEEAEKDGKALSADLDPKSKNSIGAEIAEIIENSGLDAGSAEYEKLKENLEKAANQARELANASKAASTQLSNVSKVIAGERLGDSASVEQSEAWAGEFGQAYNDFIENHDISNYSRFTQGASIAELLKAAGMDDRILSSNAVIDKDGEKYVQFADGEIVRLAEVLATAAAKVAEEAANDALIYDREDENSVYSQLKDKGIEIKEGVELDPEIVYALLNEFQFDDSVKKAFNKMSSEEQEEFANQIVTSAPPQTEEDQAGTLRSEAATNYGLDPELIEEQAKQLQELYEAEKLTATEATKLAIENQRMNKGIKTLSENWDEWSTALNSGKKGTEEYAKASKGLSAAMADLLNISSDLEISDEFLVEEFDLLQEAAKGSKQAIQELRIAVEEQRFEQAVSMRVPEGETDEVLKSAQAKVLEGLAAIQSAVAEGVDLSTRSLDTILGNAAGGAEAWVTSLNQMAIQTHMTAAEMQESLNGLGLTNVKIDVATAELTHFKPVSKQSIENITEAEYDGVGIGAYNFDTVIRNKYEPVTEEVQFAQLTKKDEEIPIGFRKIEAPSPSVSTSSGSGGGGGGGSKQSTPKKPKKSDIVERYKEINEELDDLEDSYDDVSKAADRLFGVNRIKALKQQNDLILKQKDSLEKKRKEAENYLQVDKEALDLAAKEAGVNFVFNDNDIVNYTEEMTKLYNQLNDLVTAAGDTVEDAEQEAIDELQEKIDNLNDAIKAFEDSREEIEDLDDQIQDKIYEWQDNNYEQLQYSLELKLDIEDSQLRRLEFLLNQFSDNFFKMAESAAVMVDQTEYYGNKLDLYSGQRTSLDEAYGKGEISQADYIEGLKQVRDGIYEQLDGLVELDKTMLHYYEDTLSAASEELADFTDHMEHLTSVFDHYINLLGILGKSKNYDAIGDFLGGKAETIRDRLNIAQEYYDVLLNQREDIEHKLNSAITSGDDAAVELYKEEWDAIVDETDAAQEAVLSLTQEWAEAMKAVIENNMEKISATLENALTQGLGFDKLMEDFDKLNIRQEEYLTKTNQIYETNKLMRTASKALDETDNKIAKQKLKNFVEETKGLQENTKLSQYELEIQQAKYELLLAEIALEEAQNAKSTIRLSRDSEGNFGYIYTADQDAINDAEQKTADASNRLYNISLEGQQNYTQKYLQGQQQMYEDLRTLQDLYFNEGAISQEEYEQRLAEIQEHYYGENGILTTYSNLYNIAVRTDANATADNWQKDYGQMTQDTESWKDSVDDYIRDVKEQTEDWADVSEQANEDVAGALEDSAEATEELVEESEELADIIEDDVIEALEEELDAVQEITEAYAEQRQALLDLIETYKSYLQALNQQIESESIEAVPEYDPEVDYAQLIMEHLASGGTVGDKKYNELVAAREAKITGETWMTEDYYGSRGQEFNKNMEALEEEYRKKEKLETFATGGYTGDWGPEGKLAVLHEKELVLNAQDTENLLTVMDLAKELVNIIDSQTFSSFFSDLASISAPSLGNQVVEQQVEIHAEFPSVVDRNEIEEAFNNLVNRASQYANKKNK